MAPSTRIQKNRVTLSVSQSVSHVSRINHPCIHTELFPDSRHSHACVRISSRSLPLSCLSAPLITTHSYPIGHPPHRTAPHRTHRGNAAARKATWTPRTNPTDRYSTSLPSVHCLILCVNVYVFVLVRTERNADRQTDRHETCMLIRWMDGWMMSVPPPWHRQRAHRHYCNPLSVSRGHSSHQRRNSPAVSSFLAPRLPVCSYVSQPDHNSDLHRPMCGAMPCHRSPSPSNQPTNQPTN
mmetsp:Transcript_17762/g.42671  ORF Transcript_17762/g.42671 Transcript_17762/m.42671 type:complete len:239 (+) Transcript_17762:191-907(+)